MARQPGGRRPSPRVAGHRRPVPGTRGTAPESAPVLDPQVGQPAMPEAEPVLEDSAGREYAPAPARGARGRLPELALGVAALLLAVLAVLETLSWREAKATKEARLDASVAARAAVVALISVNYEALPEGRARAVKTLAPKFRPEYEKFLTSLETTATANKLISSANVETSGVIKASPDEVTVLLFIDQISTNASRSSPRIDQPRVRMTMVKSGGAWLVKAFEVV